jgi:hypothetical protein
VPPSVFHVAFLCHPHPVFNLGESLFDRVEIGAVGRQKPEPRPCGFDGGPYRLRLVATEIVHDDDVARFEGLNELLFNIGQKACAVDRAIKDARGGHLVATERRQKRHGAPMAMRGITVQAFAFRPPATDRRHIGLDPRLINEDQTFGIKLGLPRLPAPPAAGNIRPGLLKSEQSFF